MRCLSRSPSSHSPSASRPCSSLAAAVSALTASVLELSASVFAVYHQLQALLFKERNKKASHSTDTAPTTQGPIPDSPRCHNMYMHGEVWDVED